jgi:hypothetical protein
MTDSAASAPTGRRRVLWIAGASVAAALLACAGLAAIGAILFPTTDAIRIVNRTGDEITDVRLIGDAGFPEEHEIARFPSIRRNDSATADHTGTGAFSVVYTDARGRWIGYRAAHFDEDDIRGTDPIEVLIEGGRVGNADARPLR